MQLFSYKLKFLIRLFFSCSALSFFELYDVMFLDQLTNLMPVVKVHSLAAEIIFCLNQASAAFSSPKSDVEALQIETYCWYCLVRREEHQSFVLIVSHSFTCQHREMKP